MRSLRIVRRPEQRDPNLVAIGRHIAAVREERGLTQEEAANQSKMDVRRWQRLEAGDVNVRALTLGRIAEVLGCDFWRLVERPKRRS